MKKQVARKQNLPKCFIVRVYRFGVDGPEGMVGIVETVGEGEGKGFTGIEELWEILASSGKIGKGRKPKGGSHVNQV